MTEREKRLILFIIVISALGLIFISLNRYRFYQDYIDVMRLIDAEKPNLKKRLVSTDKKEKKYSYHYKIDINSADIATLTILPGVGREIALRIVEYRSIHGGFAEIDELIKIKGIGVKKLEEIKKYAVVK